MEPRSVASAGGDGVADPGDAVSLTESAGGPGTHSNRPDDLKPPSCDCSHYFAHDGFPEDGILITEAGNWLTLAS
jgi:hypothetical protein